MGLVFFGLMLCFGRVRSAEIIFNKEFTLGITVELSNEKIPGVLPVKEQAHTILEIRPDAKFIKPDYVSVYRLSVSGKTFPTREVWTQRYAHLDQLVGPPEFVFLDALLIHSNLFICYKVLDKVYVEQLNISSTLSNTNIASNLDAGTNKDHGLPNSNAMNRKVIFRDREKLNSQLYVSAAKFSDTNNSVAKLELNFPSRRTAVFILKRTGFWVEEPVDYSPRPGIVINSTSSFDLEIFTQPNQVVGQTNATIRGVVFPADTKVWINGTEAEVSANGLWSAHNVSVVLNKEVFFRVKVFK